MSTSEGKRPKPLNEKELRKVLEAAVEDGTYGETLHASFDHPERRIDLNDVLYGLGQQWTLKGSPEFEENFWQWKYKIETKDIEGEPITIVVAVDPWNK